MTQETKIVIICAISFLKEIRRKISESASPDYLYDVALLIEDERYQTAILRRLYKTRHIDPDGLAIKIGRILTMARTEPPDPVPPQFLGLTLINTETCGNCGKKLSPEEDLTFEIKGDLAYQVCKACSWDKVKGN